MNRYLIFAFDDYYPSSGGSDFVGSARTMDDAFDSLARMQRNNYRYENYLICYFDGETLVEVWPTTLPEGTSKLKER